MAGVESYFQLLGEMRVLNFTLIGQMHFLIEIKF